jgi:hypothetical protein
MKAINMVGQVFGMLTVVKDSGLRRDRDGAILWIAQCSCGNEKLLPRCLLLKYKSCGCKRAENQSRALRKSLNRGGCGEIYASHWNVIKKNATQRGLVFDITAEYAWNLFLKQNRSCCLSGMPLQFSTRCWTHDVTASLDRIDSAKGYVVGNVQWVHKMVNFMKQEFDQFEFVTMCGKIYSHSFENVTRT